MKFSEMTYTRPDIDALLARCKELTAKAAAADSGEALVDVYYEQSRAFADYNTAANLANIHYTCDTRDAYWKAEQDFFDANGPALPEFDERKRRETEKNEADGVLLPGKDNALTLPDHAYILVQKKIYDHWPEKLKAEARLLWEKDTAVFLVRHAEP